MPDDRIELWGVRHLSRLAEMHIANIRGAKSAFGPTETGIDVAFELDGRLLGAQHTVFHFDEGQVPGKRGSPARALEEMTARAQQGPFGMWVGADYRPGLAQRINEKIMLASRYDTRALVSQTWLIVSACLNRWGGAASTMIMPHTVSTGDLNRLFHQALTSSRFDQAFLLLHIHQIAYGWARATGWRLIADPDAVERERHQRQMADLIFNQIPRSDLAPRNLMEAKQLLNFLD